MVVAAEEAIDLLGERGGRRVHRGVRVVRELLHLLRRDLRELRPAIADVHAPEAGHAVEVLAAVGIDDGRVLRGGDDELALLELLVGHDGMDHVVEVTAREIGAVAGSGGLRSGRHYGVLLLGEWLRIGGGSSSQASSPRAWPLRGSKSLDDLLAHGEALGQPLGPRGAHVVPADDVEHGGSNIPHIARRRHEREHRHRHEVREAASRRLARAQFFLSA